MKHTLIFFLSLISISLFSQGGFKIKKVSFSFGEEADMVSGLDYEYFTKQIPDSDMYLSRGVEFDDADLTAAVCENPHIGLEFAITHPKLKNFEWRNSIGYIQDRRDGVRYNSYDKSYNFISFTNKHDELTLESALIYDLKLGALHIYGGAGSNLGFSFSDEITVSGVVEVTDTYNGDAGNTNQSQNQSNRVSIHTDLPPIFTQRIFAQVGVGLAFFNKIEIGFEIKKGVGYRTIGSGVRFTQLIGGQLRLAYRI